MSSLMLRHFLHSAGAVAALLIGAAPVAAQVPARDPSARIAAVLPADVSARVLARIAEARSHDLPAAALENRAVELAAKGLPPEAVERGVEREARRLGEARKALGRGGRGDPTDAETEAAALAMSNGADGSAVSSLARSAPSGSSLAVPLFVLSSHMNRGLPSDAAIARIVAAMEARIADRTERDALRTAERAERDAAREAERIARHAEKGQSADGVPSEVPRNGGRGNRPEGPPGRNK